ncbi:MAG: methylthioribulose 1-phosphate dehydratase [Deltaproteobacteria bacterium]|jgi:methylthioribulose-1-phosphate dehydratase|nr:methylthioribulose 1-phosphate dehydratase [Deltaproteobacteria bacterium]
MPILQTESFIERAEELRAVGRFFHSRNWAPATSGNYSARVDDENIAVTVSGAHKGELTEKEIMVVNLEGERIASFHLGQRSSAETLLHTSVYQEDTSVGSVLHSHSVISTVISRMAGESVVLEGYELLKAFPGIDTHQTRLIVPVFNNQQDIPKLMAEVSAYRAHAEVFAGYLIRGHGLYSWGKNVAEARRCIEAFEFLFECELKMQRK